MFRSPIRESRRVRFACVEIAGEECGALYHSHSTEAPHRGRYVSPATQSMSIGVTLAAKPVLVQTFNLSPGSPGCSPVAGGTECVVRIVLSPSRGYAASIATYDQPNGAGSELSVAQDVPFDVLRGKDNVVPMTLSGVPAGVVLTSLEAYASYTSFTVSAIAVDLDQNFIVGPGSPEFTAAKSSGSNVVSIVTPPPGEPNTITLNLASPAPGLGSEQVEVQATYPPGETNGCDAPGADCTAYVQATYAQQLLVTNYNGNDILGFRVPLAESGENPNASIGIANPYPIAYDPQTQAATFVGSDGASPSVEYIAPPYSYGPFAVAPVGAPSWIAYDPEGNAFVSSNAAGAVYIIDSPFDKVSKTIATGVNGPFGIAVDASYILYVANYGNGTMSVYAPPYSAAPVILTLKSRPYELAISGNQIFVGEASDIDVYDLPVSASSKPVASITSGVSDVYDLTFDAAGDLFTTNNTGGVAGSVTEYKPPFTSASTPAATITGVGSGIDSPYGLIFDASGNLYVANSTGGTGSGSVTEFAPPFSSASTPGATLTSSMNVPCYMTLTPPSLSVEPIKIYVI